MSAIACYQQQRSQLRTFLLDATGTRAIRLITLRQPTRLYLCCVAPILPLSGVPHWESTYVRTFCLPASSGMEYLRRCLQGGSMRKWMVGLVVALLFPIVQVRAQTNSEDAHAVSTWSIHSPDIVVARRTVYPLGVFTPPGAIVIRRLEALSNRGPMNGMRSNGEPVPCPVQYTIELTNGITTQQIPISNVFLNKETSQTYTDSGALSLLFIGGNRITAALLPPRKPQFPPVSCLIEGLNITIQYESPQDSAQQKSESADHP